MTLRFRVLIWKSGVTYGKIVAKTINGKFPACVNTTFLQIAKVKPNTRRQ